MSNHNEQGLMNDHDGELLDFESQINVIRDWQQHRQKCVIQLLCYIVHLIFLLGDRSTLVDRPISEGDVERESMRVQQWNQEDSQVNSSTANQTDIVDEDNFQHESPNSQVNLECSPTNVTSSGTTSSRGQKRKAPWMETIATGIEKLLDVVQDGNALVERQVQVLEKTRPRHYSEGEVWDAVEKLGIHDDHKLQCYNLLCDEEMLKMKFFGVPPHLRLQLLQSFMENARTR